MFSLFNTTIIKNSNEWKQIIKELHFFQKYLINCYRKRKNNKNKSKSKKRVIELKW